MQGLEVRPECRLFSDKLPPVSGGSSLLHPEPEHHRRRTRSGLRHGREAPAESDRPGPQGPAGEGEATTGDRASCVRAAEEGDGAEAVQSAAAKCSSKRAGQTPPQERAVPG